MPREDLVSKSIERELTRRGFMGTSAAAGVALYLAACGGDDGGGGGGGGEQVTLNNLFMQQAGYSPQDLAGMTADFEKANPNIKVNNTLVPYEALHDKIVAAAPAGTYDVVLGDCIWPAEFGSKKIVHGRHRRRQLAPHRRDPQGRDHDGAVRGQVLRDAMDPRHEVPLLQQGDAREGGRRPLRRRDPRRARHGAEADQVEGHRRVPVDRELGPGRGGDLRLRAVPRRLRRQVPRRPGRAGLQPGRRGQGARVHEDAARRGAGEPELDRGARGRRPEVVHAGPERAQSELDVPVEHRERPEAEPGRGRLRHRAHSGGAERRRARLQRRPADHDHDRQRAPGRGLGVHQVHLEPEGAEQPT